MWFGGSMSPQMATGVAHLHGLRIVHRDIKVRASDGCCDPGPQAGPVMSFIKQVSEVLPCGISSAAQHSARPVLQDRQGQQGRGTQPGRRRRRRVRARPVSQGATMATATSCWITDVTGCVCSMGLT